ncbi:MAG: hypothetical protein A2Z21_10295 [Candidatus Fraserbacteria bacterium RBG_16_55_9]|uniref:DUF5671 domain-containing protein n=1 Tax=Fraserbacteria sp. (strain RBG_16_55_9) TaxID=1817864 RepID=A0A1F5V0V5_FRAXR|nr:MAG: hypothetical protein A2Z21_10295 [Candidatus Fraserbacteria bacterium RBG_16_55_9]
MPREREEKSSRVYLSMSVLAVANILTVISIVVLTIVAELFPPVKEFLNRLTGHHWITKGLLALAVFSITAGIGALVRREESRDPLGWSWFAGTVAFVGVIVLFLFFMGRFIVHPS